MPTVIVGGRGRRAPHQLTTTDFNLNASLCNFDDTPSYHEVKVEFPVALEVNEAGTEVELRLATSEVLIESLRCKDAIVATGSTFSV